MTRTLLVTLALVAGLYLAICLTLFLFQRNLLYFSQPRAVQAPENTLELAVPEGRLVVTVRPRPGAQALLYFGGNGEDVSLNLEQLAEAFPDRALYLMHYPGYGGSSGEPSEALILRDAELLYDHIRDRHEQVALVGRSLGSGVAVQLAGKRPVSRLVLITGFHKLPHFLRRRNQAYQKRDQHRERRRRAFPLGAGARVATGSLPLGGCRRRLAGADAADAGQRRPGHPP